MMVWLLAALMATMTLAPGDEGAYFDPAACDLLLNPGQSETVELTVCIPGRTTYEQIDLYLLADNTGSMIPIIQDVQSEVLDLVSTISAVLAHPNLLIGVGRYRDFPFDAFAFENQQSLSTLGFALDAISNWNAVSGNDGSEGQLYALNRIATDPIVGFRPESKRILFWFGDAPGHDPICADISGEAMTITEHLTVVNLQRSGAGGMVVLSTSVPSGPFAMGINDDPTVNSADYLPFCTIGGEFNQGIRIAQETGGVGLSIQDPTLTAETVLQTFTQFLRDVDVSLEASPSIEPFITSITPDVLNIQIPTDPNDELCLTFTIEFEADHCIENDQFFEGSVRLLFDGAPAQGESKPVTITQPGCNAVCMLLAGITPLSLPLDFGVPGPGDVLAVQPLVTLPVTLDSVPAIPLPSDPVFEGVHVFTQIYMLNDVDFPEDPLKLSNGLDFEIGGDVASFGTASGMQQWASGPAMPGGSIRVAFSIDGFDS